MGLGSSPLESIFSKDFSRITHGGLRKKYKHMKKEKNLTCSLQLMFSQENKK